MSKRVTVDMVSNKTLHDIVEKNVEGRHYWQDLHISDFSSYFWIERFIFRTTGCQMEWIYCKSVFGRRQIKMKQQLFISMHRPFLSPYWEDTCFTSKEFFLIPAVLQTWTRADIEDYAGFHRLVRHTELLLLHCHT